jgi:Protein of unknown function (DUF1275)
MVICDVDGAEGTESRQTPSYEPAMAVALVMRVSQMAHPCGNLHRAGLTGGVPLIVLAAALAFASSATDIASFAQLGEVFCSVMTGTLVLLGLAAARVSGDVAAHTAVASMATRRQPGQRNHLTVAVLVAAAAGAAAGGALLAALPATLPILPMSALAGVITIVMTVGTHQ